MIVGNYRQAFKAAIARIYHSNGAIVGAGFLVSDRHLLTCAHVVTAALGIAPETVEMPTTTLELDFPLIAPGQKVKAKVAFWQPVNPTQVGEDIAGLELEEALTEGQPVRLLTVEELWNHPFQIFGFPSKRDEGIWASGVIRDRLANGWVQIEDIKAQGQAVQPGFSGSPIWDEVLQGVVGMAVAADKKRDETKTAFMIPTAILTKAWTLLSSAIQSAEMATPEPPILALLQLTPEQRKDLRAALMAAFPSQPELELMVEDELGESLNRITQGQPNYELAVRDLVKWAEAEGKVRSLLEGAVRSNSGNPQLQALAKLWLKA